MNWGMMRWKGQPLNPKPFSPVQSARKFSEVFGVLHTRSEWEDVSTRRVSTHEKREQRHQHRTCQHGRCQMSAQEASRQK